MAEKKIAGRASRSEADEAERIAPLAGLGRTLEQLEARLSALTPAAEPSAAHPPAAKSRAGAMAREAVAATRKAPASNPKPSLSEAVSQIAMRQQMVEGRTPVLAEPASPPSERRPAKAAEEARGEWDRRVQGLSEQVDDLQADGDNYVAVADITRELKRLRDQMQAPHGLHAMREAFEALRDMIARREEPSVIDAEITRVHDELAKIAGDGRKGEAAEAFLRELLEMRQIVAAMPARTRSSAPVASPQPKRELKSELERLKGSLTALAGEDQSAAATAEDGARATGLDAEAVSEILVREMQGLREKLENLATQRSIEAVEERWGAFEERFASRGLEAKIERFAERIEQIEDSLDRLPEALQINTIEERIQTLSLNLDVLARQQQDPDADHFLMLEDRLDEISRAIIAMADQPATETAPLQQLELRMELLSARVDELSEDDDSEGLSSRVAELARRIEQLSEERASADLADRMDTLSERLEVAFAEQEEARLGASDVEARLAALAVRLEDAEAAQVDGEMILALEAQIARLSRHLTDQGVSAGVAQDPEFDERLAAIEARLDQDRDAVIAAAREAADAAVRSLWESGELGEGAYVAQLSEDLKTLEALSKHTDDRANGFFEAVHATLTKFVERLDRIEADMVVAPSSGVSSEAVAPFPARRTEEGDPLAAENPGEGKGLRAALARRFKRSPKETHGAAAAYARAAAAQEEPGASGASLDASPSLAAPALDAADYLDSSEANRPLEIGSGAPDIGALIQRVRDQQSGSADGEVAGKADFIAAARRAAMAAATEAESLRRSEDEEAPRSGVGEVLSRRRKPLLMAVGAILLALMAVPLGHSVISMAQLEGDEADAVTETTVVASAKGGDAIPGVLDTAPTDAAVTLEATATPEASEQIVPEVEVSAEPAPATLATNVEAETVDRPAPPASAVAGLLTPASSNASLGNPGAGEAAVTPAPANASPRLPEAVTAAIPTPPEQVGNAALLEAVKNGNPKALFEVGLRLMEGRTGEPKPKEAVEWFGRAASRGFAPAQYSVGTLYEKGTGVERDTGAARDWYTLAADQGNVRAMHNLAVLYATGIEGLSQPETAAEWFVQAAEHGMRDSQYNLGILYARGAGVDQDLVKSYKWFSIVAAAGDKDAEQKRQEVAKSLTPEQIAAVTAEVAAFEPKERAEEANTVDIPDAWSDKSDQTASVDMSRAVRNIQAILIKLGYEPGAPDGVAGRKTAEAIMAFQKEAGLKVTGSIDEALIRALLERKDS